MHQPEFYFRQDSDLLHIRRVSVEAVKNIPIPETICSALLRVWLLHAHNYQGKPKSYEG